jgi:hypothetical protein
MAISVTVTVICSFISTPMYCAKISSVTLAGTKGIFGNFSGNGTQGYFD